ncbi:MAG: GTPase HflX [Pseudomonadota bacterium]|nr:GTPase HflX [Pseudomonadota bacterium]
MPDPTRVYVLHPILPSRGTRNPEDGLFEAVGLAEAIDLLVVHAACVNVRRPNAARLFGAMVLDDVRIRLEIEPAELVVVDHILTPVQQRNLEREWQVKAIDRTGLILEIFGERAQTREGALQVELAALTWQRSRLVRSWTHLERQRGGFGFMGGPGETQLEIDRRLIDDRIAHIKRDLDKVGRRRDQQRKARQRANLPIVALVGYTNAGKSTLFNRLTSSDVFAQNLLFATLDPTMRAVDLPSGRRIVLSDTVGFISDLPTQLIAAFRATLEEVCQADAILHVRDMVHPESEGQRDAVVAVLGDLGIETDSNKNLIEVGNKIDLIPVMQRTNLAEGRGPIPVSALTGEGMDRLLARIEERLGTGEDVVSLTLDPADGEAMSWLYRSGEVLERRDEDGALHLKIRINPANLARWKGRFGSK